MSFPRNIDRRTALEDRSNPDSTSTTDGASTPADNAGPSPTAHIVNVSYPVIHGLTTATLSINFLPKEVLGSIFSLVPSTLQTPAPVWDFLENCMFDVRELTPLTRVCQTWKTVIFGTPSLWSTILDMDNDSSPEPLFKNYLKYCTGMGGLYLYIPDRGTGPSQDLIDLCRQHSSRVRGLYLAGCSSGCPGRCMTLLCSALPSLELCHSSSPSCFNDRQPRASLDEPHAILPESSRLRTLTLNFLEQSSETCPIPKTSFPALERLHISGLDSKRDGEKLLSLLRTSPRLQDLYICTEIGNDSEDLAGTDSDAERVPLHHLQNLELFDYELNSPEALIEDDEGSAWMPYLTWGFRQILARIALPPAGLRSLRLGSLPLYDLHSILEEIDPRMELKLAAMTIEPSESVASWPVGYSMQVDGATTTCKFDTFAVPRTVESEEDLEDSKAIAEEACGDLCNLFASSRMFTSLRGLWLSGNINGPMALARPGSVFRSLPRLEMFVAADNELLEGFITGRSDMRAALAAMLEGFESDALRDTDNAATLEQSIPQAADAHPGRTPELEAILRGLIPYPDGTVPCPSLQTVALYCGYDYDRGSVFDRVVQIARLRARAGHPLVRIILLFAAKNPHSDGSDTAMKYILRSLEYTYAGGGPLATDEWRLVRTIDNSSEEVIAQLRNEWKNMTC
ncbi:hypothetical protein C2E23DRAFT_889404 [Lenzites betulinus]|nr:hypothetical protein C2E23DRAFT_889404 [Lenzites betulinus]